jgi:CspA family cold shock protein
MSSAAGLGCRVRCCEESLVEHRHQPREAVVEVDRDAKRLVACRRARQSAPSIDASSSSASTPALTR